MIQACFQATFVGVDTLKHLLQRFPNGPGLLSGSRPILLKTAAGPPDDVGLFAQNGQRFAPPPEFHSTSNGILRGGFEFVPGLPQHSLCQEVHAAFMVASRRFQIHFGSYLDRQSHGYRAPAPRRESKKPSKNGESRAPHAGPALQWPESMTWPWAPVSFLTWKGHQSSRRWNCSAWFQEWMERERK